MKIKRRDFLRGAAAGAAALIIGDAARAQSDTLFDLTGDDGKPIVNYKLPSELSLTGLPGIIWAGSESPDVTFVEFFDYNCPYCRRAASELDAIVTKDKAFRLGLVNNAVIGVGSAQAAKVQQAGLEALWP